MKKIQMEGPEKSKNVKVEITIKADAIKVRENPNFGQVEELHNFVQQLFDANKEEIEKIFNDDLEFRYGKGKKDKIKDAYLYDFAFEAYVHDVVK